MGGTMSTGRGRAQVRSEDGWVSRVDRVVSWVIVGVFVLVVGGGLGFWWLRTSVIAPSCGDIAVGQLNAAMSELSARIPGLRFAETGDDCDSGGAVYASWEHDDLEQLLATAQAAGCQLNEMGVNQEDEDLLTCGTSGREVVLSLGEPSTFPVMNSPVSGSMWMT